MTKRILAIDPGLKGAWVVMEDDEPKEFGKLPVTIDKKSIDPCRLSDILTEAWPDLVILEKVHGRSGDGGAAAFTFGRGYGTVESVIKLQRRPLTYVTPQRWKSVVLTGTKKDKKAAIQYVLNRWPADHSYKATERSMGPDDNICEAVCIAHYGFMVSA